MPALPARVCWLGCMRIDACLPIPTLPRFPQGRLENSHTSFVSLAIHVASKFIIVSYQNHLLKSDPLRRILTKKVGNITNNIGYIAK
jgi:hypothetical protein